jgi:hypothetical protein
VRLEKADVLANRVDVVIVLAKRVEKSPTLTVRDDTVPLIIFIDEACILENVGEPAREPSVEKKAEFAVRDEIFAIFISCKDENCAELPFIDEIVSIFTFV